MSSSTRWLILGLALVGLGLSTASTWVHYQLLTDPTYVSPCDVNAALSCTQAYTSRFGSVAGVPTALGGVVWFGLVALIAGLARPTEEQSVAGAYLFALATVGLAVILYLGYASFFIIRTGCLLCIGTYLCVLGIFALSSLTKGIPVTQLPLRLSEDLRGVIARPVALVLAILYLAVSVSAVALFPREDEAAEQVAARSQAAPAPSADAQKNFADAWAQQPRVDLGVAADGAKVVIVKFNDFECPACRQAEVFYKPVLDKFAKSHPGAVKYVVKDWPWNAECNFNTRSTIPGHEAACDAAAAARIAKDKGKYDEMVAWIYANQGTSKAALREAASRILGITDFDRQYALKLADIRRDVADGGALRINSTPTYYINGVLLPPGMMPAEYFELAINLEINRAK